MSKKIIIRGSSSKKKLKEIIFDSNNETSLMEMLRSHNIPIASSCYGEGVCKKCMINDDIISCQMKVREFLELSTKYNNTITISYL